MRGDTTKVLIAGGGVAALEAALTLRALAVDHVTVELLAPEPHFWYRPIVGRGAVRARRGAPVRAARARGCSRGVLHPRRPDRRRRHAQARPNVHRDDRLRRAADRLGSRAAGCGRRRDYLSRAGRHRARPRAPRRLEDGEIRRLAFVVPAGAVWTLPVYELALMTAAHVAAAGDPSMSSSLLVTPEREPLVLFGPRGDRRDRVAARRSRNRVAHRRLRGRVSPTGRLSWPGRDDRRRRVVALPRLARPAHRRNSSDGRGVHSRRRARPRAGSRTSSPPGTSRASRSSRAGSRRSRPRSRPSDRGRGRRRPRAAALPPGAARAASHRRAAALPPPRDHGRLRGDVVREHRAALVAAGEDRRASPGAVPRLHRRRRGSARRRGPARRARRRGRARAAPASVDAATAPRSPARCGSGPSDDVMLDRADGRRPRGHARRGGRADARA